jgi:hypothetical protein
MEQKTDDGGRRGVRSGLACAKVSWDFSELGVEMVAETRRKRKYTLDEARIVFFDADSRHLD